jgi:DNA topoisomerase-3
MDKYKTSEMGKALKKVYRGEIAVGDSVLLAREEIAKVFEKRNLPPETDDYTGSFGEVVGTCPLCGRDVVRGRYKYGCRGYKEGCDFGVSLNICNRNISLSNIKLLLETGKTSKIEGFVSKHGKTFDGVLKLVEGKAVFDFTGNAQTNKSAPREFIASSFDFK